MIYNAATQEKKSGLIKNPDARASFKYIGGHRGAVRTKTKHALSLSLCAGMEVAAKGRMARTQISMSDGRRDFTEQAAWIALENEDDNKTVLPANMPPLPEPNPWDER